MKKGEEGQIDPPQKKLTSKSQAILGLNGLLLNKNCFLNPQPKRNAFVNISSTCFVNGTLRKSGNSVNWFVLTTLCGTAEPTNAYQEFIQANGVEK